MSAPGIPGLQGGEDVKALKEAFQVMTWSLYLVKGRRTQVRGVIAWESLVDYAEECAAGCGRFAGLPGGPASFRVHDGWLDSCALIIAALRDHAGEAHVLHCEQAEAARIAGEERDRHADAAVFHAAERDRWLAWAAAADDEGLRASCEAAAAAEDAARGEAERAALQAAERHGTATAAADAAMTWRTAAIQAAGAGDLLVMSEDAEVAPLIRAYANAAGQVAGAKEYHTMRGSAA